MSSSRINSKSQFKHILLVANPAARSQTCSSDWLGELIRKLNSVADCIVSVCLTSEETTTESLLDLMKPPLDLVIAAGGDGTIRFAFEALARTRSDIPIAILPLGTGNVLARNLGIVSENFFADPMEHAIDDIINGVVHPMDLGVMNGRYFAGMAGAGPLAEAFTQPAREEKTRLKMLAYIGSLLETIAHPPVRFRITTPESIFDVEASGVFVANVDDLGFGKPAHLSGLADGFLNLIILTPRDFRDYVSMGFRFVTGEAEGDEPLYIRSVEKVIIEIEDPRAPRSEFQELGHRLFGEPGVEPQAKTDSDFAVKAMIDGEIYGTTPMQIEVVPHAVKVVVPRGHALLKGEPWVDREREILTRAPGAQL